MRYLSAIGIETPPYLELYENYPNGVQPIQLGFDPGITGPISRARFSEDLTVMALATTARREDIEGLGNPDFVYEGGPIFSADSKTMLYLGTSTVPAKLLVKRGQYYVPQPLFSIGAAYALFAALSSDGKFIAVVPSDDSTNIRIYENTGTSVSLVATLPRAAAMTGMDFTSGDEYLVCQGVMSTETWASYFIQRSGSAFANRTMVSTGMTDFATTLMGADCLEDGSLAVCFMQTGASINRGHRFVIRTFANDGSGLGLSTITYGAGGNTYSAVRAKVRPIDGGKGFVCLTRYSVNYTTPAGPMAVVQIIGNTLATPHTYARRGSLFETAQTTGASGAGGALDPALAVKGNFIAGMSQHTSTQSRIFILEITSGWPSYAMTTQAQAVATLAGTTPFIDINERLGVASFAQQGNTAVNWHHSLVSFDRITTVFPGTTSPINDVRNARYSPDNNVVLALISSAPFAGVVDGGGDILDYATLEGTFITLYDREPATGVGVFVERNFVQHIVGTVITDMVFSPAHKSFMYHANYEASEEASARGRFVYWIEDKEERQFEYLGVIYEMGDQKSLASVSPSESHFAVVTQSIAQQTAVRLYRFEGTGFIETDEDPTFYGPPAWSHCDSVVVAHGGVQPYSFFEHVIDVGGDRLVYYPVEVADWDSSTVVVDIAFSLDCSKIIIVTEDEIIVLEDAPPDEEGVKIPEEEDREDRPTEETEGDRPIAPDPDNAENTIVRPPGGPGGGGGGGGASYVGPDGTITPFKVYAPYVVVTITLRNR